MLTIILTVYNKAPFLRRALDSLLTQKGTNDGDYEVLIVDDGSTDESPSIIKEYERKDARIRVLTQRNQGLSMARNNGTDAAKGDYVWYVDADDYFPLDSVRLITEAITYKPDIIPIYAQTHGDSRIRNKVPVTAKTGKDILLSGEWEVCGVFNVFRVVFLKQNNLRFAPGIYHEDSEFTPRMLYCADTVKVIPEVLYIVYHEPNSITQKPRAKRAFDYLIVADNLNNFCSQNVKDNVLAQVFLSYISSTINSAFSIIIRNSKEEQKNFEKSLSSKTHLLDVLNHTSSIKYRIEGLLFKMFKRHYVLLYRFMCLLKI